MDATVGAAERHPYLIVGGLVAVIGLFWYLSSGSKTAASPSAFTFSYGPSDAQVAAGTALQIAQTQGQTASSVAATQGATATSVAADYYSYLTKHSADSVTAAATATAGNVSANATNDATSIALANIASATSIANGQYTAATALGVAGLQSQTTLGVAGLQAGVTNNQTAAGLALGTQANANTAAANSYSNTQTMQLLADNAAASSLAAWQSYGLAQTKESDTNSQYAANIGLQTAQLAVTAQGNATSAANANSQAMYAIYEEGIRKF